MRALHQDIPWTSGEELIWGGFPSLASKPSRTYLPFIHETRKIMQIDLLIVFQCSSHNAMLHMFLWGDFCGPLDTSRTHEQRNLFEDRSIDLIRMSWCTCPFILGRGSAKNHLRRFSNPKIYDRSMVKSCPKRESVKEPKATWSRNPSWFSVVENGFFDTLRSQFKARREPIIESIGFALRLPGIEKKSSPNFQESPDFQLGDLAGSQ